MDVNEIKWNLAACRVNAGLTQEEAAAKLHISPATIVAHERGKKKSNICTVACICTDL